MEAWLESVYSDGTAEFVSDPGPKLFDTVKIRIRIYEDAPVKHVQPDDHAIALTVKAHQAYLLECRPR